MTIAVQATVLFNCVPRNEWVHHRGGVYKVFHLTNLRSDQPERFPVTVVYQNTETGDLWSRPLVDFMQRFTPKDWGNTSLCLRKNHQALLESLSISEVTHGAT